MRTSHQWRQRKSDSTLTVGAIQQGLWKHPTRLDLTLNKPAYRSGETAKLHVKAPFPGTLLLTIEREKVLSYRTIAMKENTATLSIPVRSSYRPNVYLSATLIRPIPADTLSLDPYQPLPARAFGVIPLKLDATQRRLSIDMFLSQRDEAGVPSKVPLSRGEMRLVDGESTEVTVRPNSSVDITFQVQGRRSWQKYEVCIAAVDEGILSLTDFQTPDPHDYFYRQRGLKTRSFDLYSGILPEIAGITDNSSTGGGRCTGNRSPHEAVEYRQYYTSEADLALVRIRRNGWQGPRGCSI